MISSVNQNGGGFVGSTTKNVNIIGSSLLASSSHTNTITGTSVTHLYNLYISFYFNFQKIKIGGGFVGHSTSTISITNGLVQNIQIQSSNNAGGFVGLCDTAIFNNCNLKVSNSSLVNILRASNNAGGLVALTQQTCTINSANVENINITSTTSSSSGSAVGNSGNQLEITNFKLESSNVNNVINGGSGVCGAVSGSNSFKCTNCFLSNLDIFSSSQNNIGGVVGSAQNVNITNFKLDNTLGQYNNIYGSGNVGGIAGNVNIFTLINGSLERTSVFGSS